MPLVSAIGLKAGCAGGGKSTVCRSLAELLAWAEGRVGVAVEIKNGPVWYPGIAGKTVDLVRRHPELFAHL